MTDAPLTRADRRLQRRMRRFDNPRLNPKLLWGIGLLLGIVALGTDPKVAFTITFLMGTPISFVSHYRVSFLGEGQGGWPAFLRFVVIHVCGYFLNLGGLYVLVDLAGLPHAIVQAAMVVAVAGFGFVMQKVWVFRV